MPVLITYSPETAAVWIGLAMALPLVMGVLALLPRVGEWMFRLAPLAAIPSLILSVGEPASIKWNDLMLGSVFAVSETHAVWLFFTAVLWFCSAWFGVHYLAHDEKRNRYTFFFLWAMAGNIGLILARDPASFFTAFALMSILSYGLVIHDGKPASRQAGRVYLSMAVFGEVLQFAALSMLFYPIIGQSAAIHFQALETLPPPSGLVVGLFIAGFGIKAGLLGLHVWLPMAHPVAPTPASAVLSGSMIKAGLIGWITFLPIGRLALPDASMVLMVLGLSGALVAAVLGVLQSNPKAVLAYSSVSQMGLITTAMGVGLGAPATWPLLKWAVVMYAAHHAFAKCLLFLSVGIKTTRALAGWERWLFWGGTLFAALALVGGPLTSGSLAKVLLKYAIDEGGTPYAGPVIWLMTFAATGTTILMVRYAITLRKLVADQHHTASRAMWMPWLILLFMVLFFTTYFARRLYLEHILTVIVLPHWIKGAWPMLLGLALYVGIARLWSGLGWRTAAIPPGDLYHSAVKGSRAVKARFGHVGSGCSRVLSVAITHVTEQAGHLGRQCLKAFRMAEDSLACWRYGAMAILVASVLIFWLSLR